MENGRQWLAGDEGCRGKNKKRRSCGPREAHFIRPYAQLTLRNWNRCWMTLSFGRIATAKTQDDAANKCSTNRGQARLKYSKLENETIASLYGRKRGRALAPHPCGNTSSSSEGFQDW